MWTYIWLVILVVSLVLEFVTFELVSVWVSFGSFIAMILALCGVRYEIQIAVAVVISVVCILALRKTALKLLGKTKGTTNIDSAIGVKTRLISDITSDEHGTVKYNGVVWSAKTEDDSPLKSGCMVEIVRVEGNKLVVKKTSDTGPEANVEESESLMDENPSKKAGAESTENKATAGKPKTQKKQPAPNEKSASKKDKK